MEMMGIPFDGDVHSVIGEYDGDSPDMKVFLYCGDSIHPSRKKMGVDMKRFLSVMERMTGRRILKGIQSNSIYDGISHRRIVWMRLYLPQGSLQLEYEDSREMIELSDSIAESLRESFHVEESETQSTDT